MRCAFFGGAPSLVVDLSGSDVAMAEEFLNLAEIDAGIQQGAGGRSQGIHAIEPNAFLDRARHLCHVASNNSIHAGIAHRLLAELVAVYRAPGPANRPHSKPAFVGYSEIVSAAAKVDADDAMLVGLIINREPLPAGRPVESP
jgi:hypothetical protein